MKDICEEVIRRLESGRSRVDVELRMMGTRATNSYERPSAGSFFVDVAFAFVPSGLGNGGDSCNIVFDGAEFAASEGVLRSVADSVAERALGAARGLGMRGAFVETNLVARASGGGAEAKAVILRTASGQHLEKTSDAVLRDLARVKALSVSFVRHVVGA